MLTASQPGKSMWTGEAGASSASAFGAVTQSEGGEPRSGYSTHLSETRGFLSRSPVWNGPSAGEWAMGEGSPEASSTSVRGKRMLVLVLSRKLRALWKSDSRGKTLEG